MIIASRKRRRSLEPEKRTKKQQVRAGPALQGELVHVLQEKRKEIQNENTEKYDKIIQKSHGEIEKCAGKRWLWRREQDLYEIIDHNQTEKKKCTSGENLRKFDAEMRPVMRRLKTASESKGRGSRVIMEDAEREIRKRLTSPQDPIALQHAAVGDMCDDCGVSMRVIANDSLLGCPQCAKTRVISIVSVPTADSEFVGTSYHQKNRLLEWLEFCQAKEYTEPEEDVLELIMEDLVQKRLTGLEEYSEQIAIERENGPYTSAENAISRLSINNLKEKLINIKAMTVRSSMQSVSNTRQDDKIRKFYERAPKYAAYISGYWPLRFSSQQEERIRKLYTVAVTAYDKYRKPSQPNWPGGYAYFLRCLCALLGWDEFQNHFNVSASTKNMQEREALRQKIWSCDLDWEYVSCSLPSMCLVNK